MKTNFNPIAGVIYDEDGQRTFTTNVDVLTMEMRDKLLVNSFRNTIYQKALFLEAERLRKNGVDIIIDGYEYEPTLISNSINSMSAEILNRFGQKFYNQLQEQITEKDLAFLKNRPKDIK